jgi:ribosomal protein S18 acetylase RimI-like enzyme
VTVPFHIEALADTHDRESFSSGDQALDRYLQTQVAQDIRRRITNCFVAIEATSGSLAGYYTMSASSIALPDLPPDIAKRLPRYPTIPAVRIGRLAVDQRYQGRGLGEALLINAVRRTLDAPIGAFAMVVDAKHDMASAFYRRHGFISFANQPHALFLPLATAAKSLL